MVIQPFCAKKAEDLAIMTGYLEGRITGSGAAERYNGVVRAGRRSGYFREPSLPFTRDQGVRMAQLKNATKARAVCAVNVNDETKANIRRDQMVLKFGHARPSMEYGYSVSVIRRNLSSG